MLNLPVIAASSPFEHDWCKKVEAAFGGLHVHRTIAGFNNLCCLSSSCTFHAHLLQLFNLKRSVDVQYLVKKVLSSVLDSYSTLHSKSHTISCLSGGTVNNRLTAYRYILKVRFEMQALAGSLRHPARGRTISVGYTFLNIYRRRIYSEFKYGKCNERHM